LYRVGLIGAGNMGQAMLGAWLDSGTLQARDIVITDKDAVKADAARDVFGVDVADLEGVGSGAGIVIIAVKPQDSAHVLSALTAVLTESQTIVSIAAGLTLSSIREKVGALPTLVRAMPNMAARVKAAVTAYAIDLGEGQFDHEEIRRLLSAIGDIEEVDERWMDLVTAVSGSGPAYFFYLTEALEEAAIELGMEPQVARTLATGTLWGAAKTVKETGSEPADLRRAVSSPGGTTLAALGEMDSAGFMGIIKKAVEAAARRAGELAS
jgi:pyrroline-5-carboxylate reductase